MLRDEGDFLLVKNRFDGAIGLIPRCCTGEWGGQLHGWINLDSFVSVKSGEDF